MSRLRRLPLAAAFLIAAAVPAFAQAPPAPSPRPEPVEAGMAAVNGVELYYEVWGAGEPLLVLHGGVIPDMGPSVMALAASRQVVVVQMQGHGNTPDADRPLRYETMADDVAAFIAYLGLGRTDVLGYSMGGGIALQLAIRHPDLVDRMVLVSTAARRDGWFPEVLAGIEGMRADPAAFAAAMRQAPFGAAYPDVNWETLAVKMAEMELMAYDWMADVPAILSPIMLIYADADGVTPEHMVELWQAIGGGLRDAGLDGAGRPAS